MNNKYDVSEIITKRFGKMFDYSTYLTHIFTEYKPVSFHQNQQSTIVQGYDSTPIYTETYLLILSISLSRKLMKNINYLQNSF